MIDSAWRKDELERDLITANDELADSGGAVELVASSEVSEAADRLLAQAVRYKSMSMNAARLLEGLAVSRPPNLADRADEVESSLGGELAVFDMYYNEFVAIARQDVGTDAPR